MLRRKLTAARAVTSQHKQQALTEEGPTGGGVQREGVDDVRLNGLKVEDHARADERDADVWHNPVYVLLR